MTFKEFSNQIKQLRLTKNWYQFVGTVEGKQIRLKGYKTWLQIYDVNGVRYGTPSDTSVKDFNANLEWPFK